MYLVKTPQFIQQLFPNYTWRVPTEEKEIYLTFDDGPIPEVTPWVLNQLAVFNAKATFFCVGENVEKHPDVFQQVSDAGHTIGNHTYNHLDGWATDNIPYFHNTRHGASVTQSNLFRPPYGKLKPRQAQFLQRHYRIVMWDVLSADFDPNISKEQCLQNVMRNVRPGSIIVFHDSLKAKEKLEYVLPQVLAHFSHKGYTFESLKDTNVKEQQVQVRKSA